MKKINKVAKLANVLIAVSLIGLIYIFFPVAREESKYQVNKYYDNRDSSQEEIKKELTPVNIDFSIVIPKIYASAPIVANVDPTDPDIFLPALRQGIAHAKGTSFPDQDGNVYLFAHSTDAYYNVGRYNAVFYLLGKLKKGDTIYIYYQGKKYDYSVEEVRVVSPDAVSYLKKESNEKTLTLQTCYPPGTTLKRLVVIASEKQNK
ncbi:sortase [Patescibacteria group bacterium]